MTDYDMMEACKAEREASKYLYKVGYKCVSGMLYHPDGELHHETPEESAAINYLCAEWDYAFHMGEPKRPS